MSSTMSSLSPHPQHPTADQVVQSRNLTGQVQKAEQYPFNLGGFADIYKARWLNSDPEWIFPHRIMAPAPTPTLQQVVAVKVLRCHMPPTDSGSESISRAAVLRVRIDSDTIQFSFLLLRTAIHRDFVAKSSFGQNLTIPISFPYLESPPTFTDPVYPA